MNGRAWTDQEDGQLRTAYPHLSTKEIAGNMGISVHSVYNRAFILGLKKDPEYLKVTLKNLSKKLQESGQAYRFAEGHVPANHKPVGYERLTRDGYIEVKISEPNKFVLKHRIVWEQVNGPIPKGYNVQFRNGNREDTTPDNLYLISRSDQMKHENSYHANYPVQVRKLIQIKGALQRQINKINNHE